MKQVMQLLCGRVLSLSFPTGLNREFSRCVIQNHWWSGCWSMAKNCIQLIIVFKSLFSFVVFIFCLYSVFKFFIFALHCSASLLNPFSFISLHIFLEMIISHRSLDPRISSWKFRSAHKVIKILTSASLHAAHRVDVVAIAQMCASRISALNLMLFH